MTLRLDEEVRTGDDLKAIGRHDKPAPLRLGREDVQSVYSQPSRGVRDGDVKADEHLRIIQL